MKLILANNQTDRFVAFYRELQAQSSEPFDYAGYNSLLFIFNSEAERPLEVKNLATGKNLSDYNGIYINGYLRTYELAAAVAIVCQALGIGYANKEFQQPVSLSKLSMYARLAAAGVPIPRSLAGTKAALLQASQDVQAFSYPAILKRADADQGIDNFKISEAQEIVELLADHDDMSLWVLQEFVPNDGFYLISFYDQQPKFCIFRSLEIRPDGNKRKAHMYKPKGGANAALIELAEVPAALMTACQQAVMAMNRQIASVDCLYDSRSQKAIVLEVNYNPQLVTIETYKDVRVRAFLENIKNIGD